MSIQVGERIPEVTLKRIREGVETVDTTTLFDGRRPMCSSDWAAIATTR